MSCQIALFDMDGVLLESQGYHIALQETVRQTALELGLADPPLSREAIAAFEAGGITCEWDEAAICHAVMLREGEDSRLKEVIEAVARRLGEADLLPLQPLERAEKLLLEMEPGLSPALQSEIRRVLRQARLPEASASHRLFQELILGSAEYSRIYGRSPQRATPSYLALHDRPYVDDALRLKLQAWLSQPRRAAAILTARPSLPPAGFFGTPEAEIGAALVGLPGLPISGWGGLSWLGELRRLDAQYLLKPSPVHALAALQMALGAPYETALESGMRLGWDGQAGPEWAALAGAEVSVFEDTRGGIRSLLAAQQSLAQHGIAVQVHLCGIATHPAKVSALEAAGAVVYPTLAEALAGLLL